MAKTPIILTILALNFVSVALAFDTSPLQDLCVADLTSTVKIDGVPCKDPTTVTGDDFFYSGLHIPANTSNQIGAGFKVVTAKQVPGMNTLGLYTGRMDLQPNGYVPPHFHSRGSEVMTVLEGSMEIGFVTSYPYYKYIKKVLKKGDLFVVPVGLIHGVRHVGTENTVVFFVMNSQNPGTTTVTASIFAAQPPLDSDYLSKAFMLDKEIVEKLQNQTTF